MNKVRRRPEGKFRPKEEFVVVERFMQLKPGQKLPRCSYSKMRSWWRRGLIAYASPEEAVDEQEIEEAAVAEEEQGDETGEASVEQDSVEDEPEVEIEETLEPEVVEATAIEAEEGEKGWWKVLFDDGTEKKMRRSDVEALGLLEVEEDGEEV